MSSLNPGPNMLRVCAWTFLQCRSGWRWAVCACWQPRSHCCKTFLHVHHAAHRATENSAVHGDLHQSLVAKPLADAGLVPGRWLDAVCLNMYHDGSEGIQSHFDDAHRFERPIFSLRLFSDSRLSFGTQLYG